MNIVEIVRGDYDPFVARRVRSYPRLENSGFEAEIAELKEELKTATGQKRVKAVRRLDALMPSISLVTKPGMDVLDIFASITTFRPMVQLMVDVLVSDLNDL